MTLVADHSLIEPDFSFHGLYESYHAMVRKRVRRFYGPQESEDIVQDVFVRAIEKLHTFRGDCAFSTWLWKVTTRHCLNRLRDTERRQVLLQSNNGTVAWSPTIAPPNQEAAAELNQLLGSLEPKLSRFARQYYIEGRTQIEIAAVEGCSRRTVGNRLRHLNARAEYLRQREEERLGL